jgi:predicted 3-demethylubiquinone-9 3-methyltransferase (glyoxalase superfamily)
MLQEIGFCLWFNQYAKEAALFYQSTFSDFTLQSENPMAVNYQLFDRKFMHLNGGPGYPINPSISFFVNLDSEEEIQSTWEKLSQDGAVLMPLNAYPWSQKYGWCADKYGVNWQLMLGHKFTDSNIMPSMMFTGPNNGRAAEAIQFYTSIFPNSETISVSTYEKGEHDIEGNVKYSQFLLNGKPFGAMDSSMDHGFNFNEGVSFRLTVDTQEEIDLYWDLLVKDGSPGRCGWLKDQFGISWQILPSMLGKLMMNPETAPKVTYAFLQMSKLIIADLEKAGE